MLRKRYYILFVARDEDGRIRKIPLPIHYAYGFVAAALIGAFTIVGLAGSYTRMLLKTESFNQMRAEQETCAKSYKQMAQIAHDRDVQVASLGALANEVTALYGLRQSKLSAAKPAAAASAAAPTPAAWRRLTIPASNKSPDQSTNLIRCLMPRCQGGFHARLKADFRRTLQATGRRSPMRPPCGRSRAA